MDLSLISLNLCPHLVHGVLALEKIMIGCIFYRCIWKFPMHIYCLSHLGKCYGVIKRLWLNYFCQRRVQQLFAWKFFRVCWFTCNNYYNSSWTEPTTVKCELHIYWIWNYLTIYKLYIFESFLKLECALCSLNRYKHLI